MSRFLDGFDRAWRWWSVASAIMAVAGAGFIAFVVVAHAREDREFMEARLRPLARSVEAFRDEQHRLPSSGEFKVAAEKIVGRTPVEYYAEKPGFVSEWGTPGHDFMVGVSRGEWMHYYRSWDGKDFAGEMAPLREPPPKPR